MSLRKICLLLILITFAGSASAEIPDFGLQTTKGKPFKLDTVIGKGKWVMVVFWATDCPVCKVQEPLNSKFHEARSDKDAEVVGISIDGLDKGKLVEEYLLKHPLSYPNYLADLSMVAFNYEALTGEAFRGTPTHVLFSPDGEFKAVAPGMLRIEALEDYIAKHSDG